MYATVAPVTHQVIIEPGIGQFREFESPRVHAYSYKLVGISSWAQIDMQIAREEREFVGTSSAKIDLRIGREERELATTLDEKSTSSGIAEPYAR